MKRRIPLWVLLSLMLVSASACLPFAVTVPGGIDLPSRNALNDPPKLLATFTDTSESIARQKRSCPEGASIRPLASGQVVTERRKVAQFSEIALVGMGEMYIRQGSTTSVEVQADKSFLTYVEARLDGDTLILAIPEEVCILQSEWAVQYNITVEDLSFLHVIGAGVVALDELHADKLRIKLDGNARINLAGLQVDTLITDLNGTGSVQAAGIAQHQTINLNGVGDYVASDLVSDSADVKLNGTGNLELWVKSDLRAQVNGLGTLSYFGEPNLHTDTSGLGKIEPLGSR